MGLENVKGDEKASNTSKNEQLKKFSCKNPTEELHRTVHFTVYNKIQKKLATFCTGLKFSDFFIVNLKKAQ